MNAVKRNNLVYPEKVISQSYLPGFGCDQHMWRYVALAFEHDYKVILFDNTDAGHSDLSAYDEKKCCQLQGYAGDIIDIRLPPVFS